MKFKKFGNKKNPAIILLHGGGLSYWSLNDIVAGLQTKYYVITPIIDGHGEDGETDFLSIENSAHKLISFIETHLNGRVFVLSGLSIGAQIVTEVISLKPEITEFAVIESALVYQIKGLYAITKTTYNLLYRFIKQKWFAKWQSKSLFVDNKYFDQYFNDSLKMSKQSLINIALSNGNFQLKKTISDSKSKVLIIAGDKELKIMLKSAKLLYNSIPGSKLYIAPKMGHGELSLKNPNKYLEIFNAFINFRE